MAHLGLTRADHARRQNFKHRISLTSVYGTRRLNMNLSVFSLQNFSRVKGHRFLNTDGIITTCSRCAYVRACQITNADDVTRSADGREDTELLRDDWSGRARVQHVTWRAPAGRRPRPGHTSAVAVHSGAVAASSEVVQRPTDVVRASCVHRRRSDSGRHVMVGHQCRSVRTTLETLARRLSASSNPLGTRRTACYGPRRSAGRRTDVPRTSAGHHPAPFSLQRHQGLSVSADEIRDCAVSRQDERPRSPECWWRRVEETARLLPTAQRTALCVDWHRLRLDVSKALSSPRTWC